MSRMVFCGRMAGCGKDNLIMASKKTGQLHRVELLSCVAIAFCYSTAAITFLNLPAKTGAPILYFSQTEWRLSGM